MKLRWVFCWGVLAVATAQRTAAQMIEVRSWQRYFNSAGVTGSILLYEPQTGLYRTSDLRRAQTRYRPASTFKIFTALAALEAGVVDGPDGLLH